MGGSCNEGLQPLVIQLRQEIEVFALGNAIDRLGKDDFERLDELVEGLRQACAQDELGQVIHYDMALHRFLIEASGVEELLTIWLPIVSRMMLHYVHRRAGPVAD